MTHKLSNIRSIEFADCSECGPVENLHLLDKEDGRPGFDIVCPFSERGLARSAKLELGHKMFAHRRNKKVRAWYLIQQNNHCAICGKPHPRCLDHDGATEMTRGFLCYGCNNRLGRFEDDPVAMEVAGWEAGAKYIRDRVLLCP